MKISVYQMIQENGGPGFWVCRTTWGKHIARVVAVGDMSGPPPYYGNPPVIMDVYSVDGALIAEGEVVPVPGTRKTWRQIEPPVWVSEVAMRPLDDPRLAALVRRAS